MKVSRHLPAEYQTFRPATWEECLRYSREDLLKNGIMPRIGGRGRGFYSLGVRSASLTVAGNYVDLRSGASVPLRVVEIGVSVGVAGASPTLGLARETAVGTASTTAVPQAEEPGDPASTAVIGTAWSVAPTVSASLMRRITLPATLGAGWVWAWPESNPLPVAVSSGLMITLAAISAATATAIDAYIRHLE